MVISFCFPAAFLAFPIISETEAKLKYALNMMGCRLKNYWIGSFLFDYVGLSLIPIVFLILSLSLNHTDIFVKPLAGWMGIFLSSNFALIGFSYY